MKIKIPKYGAGSRRWFSTLASTMVGLTLSASAMAFNVTVEDESLTAVTGFRWLLEEDTTHTAHLDASGNGIIDNTDPALALRFFASHHPVVTEGEEITGSLDVSAIPEYDSNKRYFLSILPFDNAHTLSGVAVPAGNEDNLVAQVSTMPLPTAKISIQLFEDSGPINGVLDLGSAEQAIDGTLNTGFHVVVEDAGGGYGATGGLFINDVYGHPLGTKYLKTCDKQGNTPGTGTYGCLNLSTCDANGLNPGAGALACLSPAVTQLGDGNITFDANGFAVIENLSPAKYGVQVIPPTGSDWVQTTTLEGTHIIDAWAKAGNPKFFVEFGPPGPHVSIGFTHRNMDLLHTLPAPGVGESMSSAITGTITNNHLNRPPNFGFYSGNLFPGCLIALNESPLAGGRGLLTTACDANSNFSLPPLPPGTYQISVWDEALDLIIASSNLTVNADGSCVNPNTTTGGTGSCALGDLPVFNWFGKVESNVFYDVNENGFWDPNEIGINDLTVNLRHRNGQLYQTSTTDFAGEFAFEETFPFFNWLVAEVDFAAPLRDTGYTYMVDDGGGAKPVPPLTYGVVPNHDTLVPQPQCLPGGYMVSTLSCVNGPLETSPSLPTSPNPNNLTTTVVSQEPGSTVLLAQQVFLGQTNVINWGKRPYIKGENGGITGTAYYASTRAEDDPAYAAFEPWEPGIPRVVFNLYADGDTDNAPWGTVDTASVCGTRAQAGTEDVDWNGDGCIDIADGFIEDLNGDGVETLADADNYPFGNFPSPEDRDNGMIGMFDYGDALQAATSDSWDDNLPTECQGEIFIAHLGTSNETTTDCFDGLRNFNQIRPGVYDGGFSLQSHYYNAVTGYGMANNLDVNGNPDQANLVASLPSSDYIVEAVTPKGYEIVKEEDKNVELGETYVPAPSALPAVCAGDMHMVQRYLSLQTDSSGSPFLPPADLIDAPFFGEMKPLCDRKMIHLADKQNAASDYAFFTQVPKGANVTGIVLNDLANEFDPNAPTFGEKAAPQFIPISFRDWTGRELVRVYTDEYGAYNAILPSSWTPSIPSASGFSPNMLTSCINDAGPIIDNDPLSPTVGQKIIDPRFNRKFSQFCYTFQYMPGGDLYLDTPVVPIAAFARNGVAFPVDCEFVDGIPTIYSVTNATNTAIEGPLAQPGQSLKIISVGQLEVPNPNFDGLDGTQPEKITRNYGFGAGAGNVVLQQAGSANVFLTGLSWTDGMVTGTIPAATAPGQYQLTLLKPNSTATQMGITVHVVASTATARFRVIHPDPLAGATPIQDAIEDPATQDGDILLLASGIYDELVIMHKAVKLQGVGPFATTINARKVPAEKLQKWRDLLTIELLGDGVTATASTADDSVCLLPNQAAGVAAVGGEPALFAADEGAGIMVIGQCARNANDAPMVEYQANGEFGNYVSTWQPGDAHIDGIGITGGDIGGGIFVAQYAANVTISNNRILGNAGNNGGGIHIGNNAGNDVNIGVALNTIEGRPVDSKNDNPNIHNNQISENGSLLGAGGGIALYTGSDNYQIKSNYVCGNFSRSEGGGIGHKGLSENGLIERNKVIFNQNFEQTTEVSGGGIFVGGAPVRPQVCAVSGLVCTTDAQCSNQQGDICVAPAVKKCNVTGDLCTIDADCPASTDPTVPLQSCVIKAPATNLSAGSGNVIIDKNQIQGNQSLAGDGGGIRAEFINGQDVQINPGNANPILPDDPANWFTLQISNNMIVNNQAGLAGGGISLQDAVKVTIVHNTVAHNDATGTTVSAFPAGSPQLSMSQPAGVVTHAHSTDFAVLPGAPGTFSVPVLDNNIIWENRSYCWGATQIDPSNGFPLSFGLIAANGQLAADGITQLTCANGNTASRFNDLAVIGTAGSLSPRHSNLTDPTAGVGNISADPLFKFAYFNVDAGQTVNQLEATIPQTAAAFDEGGNFIDVRFSPLTLVDVNQTLNTVFDYHVNNTSPVLDAGSNIAPIVSVADDFDSNNRPIDNQVDMGADETALGFILSPALDSDGDGTPDNLDNCTLVANADQRDSNNDGFGNMCDADLNNDGLTNFTDLGIMKTAFSTYNADADFNGNGSVDFTDLGIMKGLLFKVPGPAGTLP